MYEMLMPIAGDRIHYSICGHSHRAGAYAFEGTNWLSLYPGSQRTSARLYSDPKQPERLAPVGNYKVLVCGASGPFSYQNMNGELGGYGMDFPQGLILDVPHDAVEWKKNQSHKPRLAVVLDYLWCVGGIAPFLGRPHIWCKCDKPELAERARMSQFPIGTHVMNLDAQELNAMKGAGNVYVWEMNPRFIAAVGGNPIAEISLHAVHKRKEMPPMGPLVISPTTANAGSGGTLSISEGNVIDFYKKIESNRNDIKEFMLFFSIKLKDPPDKKLSDIYDIESPWCFPVEDIAVADVGNGGLLDRTRRGFARPLDTIGGEVPKFEDYKKREEYRRGKTRETHE
jgi:hypothetical protein